MANILIVCTANICRSPVVEALLKECLNQRGYTDWQVSSAGTWAMNGQPASRFSVEVLADKGLNITNHRSAPVSDELMAWADLILCLASGHAEALKAEFPVHSDKIHLLSAMSGQAYSVHDPYGEPRPAYERMVAEVTGLVDDGLPKIIELASNNRAQRPV